MATTSLCANQHTAQTMADKSMQKQEWNMHSTKENISNKSYPVNHFQKAIPGAKQEPKERISLESSGARWVLDRLLPNTLGILGNRG